MIIVTGAEGFIGSCLVAYLNAAGYNDLVLVDDFGHPERSRNLQNKIFTEKINRPDFLSWFSEHANRVQFVFHIGARTDTTDKNEQVFKELNLEFTQQLWKACVREGIALVYASSAATYGAGEHGYDDQDALLPLLKPLNPYGRSKNDFDNWAMQQTDKPYFWAGLKFFNVYGPNEYHKGRMASVVFHAYRQIKETGRVKLFRSHKDGIADGEQQRDFIYVKDLCDVCLYFLLNRKNSGIYNLGSGKARSFNDLARAVFKAMALPQNIEYIDTPEDIRDTYQYFTEASMQRLRLAGYEKAFTSLEEGIKDYVGNYLTQDKIW